MKIILTAILLQIAYTAFAQHPFAWQLTEDEGLPSMETYDLYQDKKGYVWIGTDKGLCKYNGKKFYYYKNENQKGQALSGIQQDKNGRIWVRNFKNQLFYIDSDSLHYFSEIEEINLLGIVNYLIDNQGNVWIAGQSTDTVYCYKQDIQKWKRWTVVPSDTNVYSRKSIFEIVETGNQDYYITTIYGLYRIYKDSLFFVTKNNLLKSKNLSADIKETHLFNYNKQLLLFQHDRADYAIHQFNKGLIKTINNTSQKEYFHSKKSHSVSILSDNSIWQLTLDGGTGPILNNNQSGIDNNLILFPNEGISDIILDHEGNYWISSLKNGVYIIPHISSLQYNTPHSIFPKGKLGILAKSSKENLLISTDKGKILSYNSKLKKIDHYYNTPNTPVNSIFCSKNKVLINGDGFQRSFDKLGNPYPSSNIGLRTFKNSCIYKDSFIISANGAYGLEIHSIAKKNTTQPILLFPHIPSRHAYNPEKKVTIFTKGINYKRCRWVFPDETNNRFLAAWIDTLMCYPEEGPPFAIYDEKNKPIQALRIIATENGTIWVTTPNKGIYGFNEDLKIIHHFTTQDGLCNNQIEKIKTDGNNLWLMANKVIQFLEPSTKAHRIYSSSDGFPVSKIKDLEVIEDKVWLSTNSGLISFDKNMPSKNNTAPPIFINQITINGKDTIPAASYDLDYTKNTLAIYIEGISFRSQGDFKYQYRMLGLDTTWRTQSSSVNLVQFFELNPRTYTFEVIAINEDGVKSANSAKIEFTIAPPYWQTWWFQLLIYGTIILVIAAIIWNQISRQRLRNRVSALRLQALQSQMNPHFVFNAMSTIQSFWVQKQPKTALIYHAKFAKLMRLIFDYSKELSIHIEDEIDFLKTYTSLEQIRYENEIEVIFEIEDDFLKQDIHIPPLLIQPIVENSFKHGLLHKKGKGKIQIGLKKDENYVYCFVKDDGIGRAQAKELKTWKNNTKKKRSSLDLTQERLSILNQTYGDSPQKTVFRISDVIKSNSDVGGTITELWIPLINLTE